jgi:hypothetical protein
MFEMEHKIPLTMRLSTSVAHQTSTSVDSESRPAIAVSCTAGSHHRLHANVLFYGMFGYVVDSAAAASRELRKPETCLVLTIRKTVVFMRVICPGCYCVVPCRGLPSTHDGCRQTCLLHNDHGLGKTVTW